MKLLIKNKEVVIFYTLIICFTMLWLWRVEKLEETDIKSNDIVMLDIKY